MKLKEIVSFEGNSVFPNPETFYHLYSLPSFDENRTREEVYGYDIQSNKYLVPNKCILFNKLNVRFKRIWKIESNEENKLCSTEFLPLVVNESIADFNYCFYLLHSDHITNYLSGQNSNTSGSHKRIDPHNFLEIDVVLPSLEHQKKIGIFLTSIDEKISLNRAINKNLEALAKQIYDYWFVQFDFPDENGRPYKSSGGKMVWNEKLKREIPECWEAATISDVSEVFNGATPSTSDEDNYGGDVIWITPKDLSTQQSKFVYKGERNISMKGYESCSTHMLPINTILMSSRAPIGLLAIAKEELCTNQGFKSFVPKNKNMSTYLYYYLQHHIRQVEQLGSGTTFKEVSRDDILKFTIIKPSEFLLDQFEVRLQSINEMQLGIQKENENLIKQRDELLPLLMNGQVTIK